MIYKEHNINTYQCYLCVNNIRSRNINSFTIMHAIIRTTLREVTQNEKQVDIICHLPGLVSSR